MTAHELEQQPAFPQEYHDATGQHIVEPGLTKLELFTLKAMQGLLTNRDLFSDKLASIGEHSVIIARATLATLAELAKEL